MCTAGDYRLYRPVAGDFRVSSLCDYATAFYSLIIFHFGSGSQQSVPIPLSLPCSCLIISQDV